MYLYKYNQIYIYRRKAHLLAGVGFASNELGADWVQLHNLSCRTGFRRPLLDMMIIMSNCDSPWAQTPLRPSPKISFVTTRSQAQAQTHTQRHTHTH